MEISDFWELTARDCFKGDIVISLTYLHINVEAIVIVKCIVQIPVQCILQCRVQVRIQWKTTVQKTLKSKMH